MKRRIWEIDFLRVIAVIFMIIFHFIYDLTEFTNANVYYYNTPWRQIGTSAAFLFIFVSGVSSGLSGGNIKRGFKVVSYGIVVTIATYIFLPDQYIRFGILHFLGVSMMISPILHKLNKWILLFLAILIAYNPLQNILASGPLLLPLGIKYLGFASLDYYPLIPYLWIFILGILVYKIYYYKKKSIFSFTFEHPYITFISKNSLIIYLIHQPIIIAILFLLGMITLR